jgi:hypothetical protein
MTYKTCNFGLVRAKMKGTLHEEQSTFSAVYFLLWEHPISLLATLFRAPAQHPHEPSSGPLQGSAQRQSQVSLFQPITEQFILTNHSRHTSQRTG